MWRAQNYLFWRVESTRFGTYRPSLMIGIHPFWWPDGQPVDAITKFLSDLGYEVKNTSGAYESPEKFSDYFCVHKSVLLPACQPAAAG